MAYVSTTTNTAASTNLDGLNGWFAARAEAFRNWRAYRRTLAELEALTNRDLADLGLSRSGLKRLALEATYGENV
ncbi:DUF1127 domain-containing protein [Oceanomicrobium pacificus]|uniref:DUF1127 domain-containing protein n=1 Tax=Oceanomicrobium pacificus TaxID=2692916 RepID=A0A6B0TMQ9_9RHOB|nr:DUF1127 domain-containing protein [Oceanomicrobium pacificus]MXU63859.1 DUF1127 domain-containing protein [Oceanomicrobium pacificus]